MYALTTFLQQSCSLCKIQCDLEILSCLFFPSEHCLALLKNREPPISLPSLLPRSLTGHYQLSQCAHMQYRSDLWSEDALIVTEWERRLAASWSVGVKMVSKGMPRVPRRLLGNVFLCNTSVWWKKLWAVFLTSIGDVNVTVTDKMLFFAVAWLFLW